MRGAVLIGILSRPVAEGWPRRYRAALCNSSSASWRLLHSRSGRVLLASMPRHKVFGPKNQRFRSTVTEAGRSAVFAAFDGGQDPFAVGDQLGLRKTTVYQMLQRRQAGVAPSKRGPRHARKWDRDMEEFLLGYIGRHTQATLGDMRQALIRSSAQFVPLGAVCRK